MNMMVTHPQGTGRELAQDPVRQLFDRLFEGTPFDLRHRDESSVVTSQWAPPVDIREEPDRFVLHADIPGVEPEDIEVHMDRGMLAIKGERRVGQHRDEGRYARVERMHGQFHRRFALPDSADPDRISASGRNGVLEVVIPKRAEARPRRIQVGSVLNG
ncbi:MAG: Hsp20/alpha crystallin family protein [Lysobacteraceae bacterium]